MFFLMNAMLISGTMVAGIKIIGANKRQLSLIEALSSQDTRSYTQSYTQLTDVSLISKFRKEKTESYFGEMAELSRTIQTALRATLVAMDDQYQHFMITQFDRRLGRPIHQDLDNDLQENLVTRLNPQEKTTNRNVAIAGISTTIVWVAGQSMLSLLITLPASIYLLSRVYKLTYQALVIEHRIKLEVLWALYGTLALAGGYIGAMNFSLMLGFLSSKLILITQERSHQKMIDVFGQQPHTVWVLVDGIEIELPFERLQLGDVVIVSAGQPIPVDGSIVHGMATIDQHTLTGEAQPAEKGVGETVFATTVILGGKIHVRVEKAGQDSIAAQIAKILGNTSSYRTTLESKGMEVANKTVLPRLLFGGLAWSVVGLEGATAVLGCGMGNSVRFASPIAMLNFLHLASRQGILIKDGRSLELLNEIDTIVFDKTGTLTVEQPHVSRIYPLNDITEKDLLYYAAATEHRQTHPIARAILSAAAERGVYPPTIDYAQIEVGYGIKAKLEGKEICVGSHRYMAVEGIDLPSEVQTLQTQCQSAGYSLVFVAIDHQLAGVIELQPTIRPEAREVIHALHKRNFTLYIISGDQEEPTRKMAEELGIDHYYANTLPENKAKIVEQLQQEGHSVCFIGDGINDTIALKKAHASISLLGATTIATDTAQIVLMDQSLQQLPELFKLANDFNTNMQNGFALAIVPGAFFIGGVFLFHWGIYGSIVITSVSLFASIANALLPSLAPDRSTLIKSKTKQKAQ